LDILALKDDFHSKLHNLCPAIFVRNANTAKIKIPGTDLPLTSLFMPEILAKQ